ncbi:class IV lanthionine synthetase LanL [Actinophytocola sp.]|uniref:class IV lanthionine synthetase LanL n=1 Tax=Actinophytocola sp. TaxID=1872138 RepID=UPI002ED0DBA5
MVGDREKLTEVSFVDDFLRVRDDVVRLHGWRHTVSDIWCYVTPPGQLTRPQGWKIHLSATPRSASRVLEAASRVLFEHRVAYKFAKGLTELRSLLSVRCSRGAGGKFITIYPSDDEQFRSLLDLLHEATDGMEGPAILSDRRYRPESLVHYRYGGFSGTQQVLESDGAFVPMLVAPDGEWTPDNRNAWYSPPSWAPLPLPAADDERKNAERGTSKVMLDDRFVVYEAIRHSNRGGVYRAMDEHTGAKVIIKEARPFVAAEPDGTDARDFLRNEYETLRLLAPLRVATQPVSLFEYQGHLFLAEEEVPGITLTNWVDTEVRQRPDRVIPLDRVLPIARQLVDLAATVHDKGLVFRDFTPNNVMVTPDETLALIDTEFLAVPGQQVTRVMTMSYVAPEEVTGPPRYPAPPPTADLYSVGASLFYLCGGTHALIPADDPDGTVRPHDDRIGFLIDAVAGANPTLRALAPVLRGLMCADPDSRTPLHRVRERLEAFEPNARSTSDPALPTRLTAELQQRLLDDGRRQIVAAMTPENPENLWPATPLEGRMFDPLSVQAGIAGTIDALRRAVRATGDDELRATLGTAATWLDRRLRTEGRTLPGLYFGRAGTHWALYEAAVELGDQDMADRAVERAKHLPVVWNNPDLTHGVAGSGMAQLHLWRRTNDPDLRERVLISADTVLSLRVPDEMVWPVRNSPDPNANGLVHYGFAHGTAGICAFLLAAGTELDRPDLVRQAVDGGELLLSLAQLSGDGAWWPIAQEDADGSERLNGSCWWCSGAPGIGTFLIRLWRATGDERYRDAAHRAAVATRAERWLLAASHCHGLAGNGEFLLDMAAATGDEQYRDWAEEHALALYRLTALREDRLVVMNETGAGLSYGYNTGFTGAVGFLHRLRHGGERWWMVDDLALPTGPR